jgi:hypothetical protein
MYDLMLVFFTTDGGSRKSLAVGFWDVKHFTFVARYRLFG